MNDPRPLIINASVTEIFDDGIVRAIVLSSILIQSCVIVISVHLCLVFLMQYIYVIVTELFNDGIA